MLTGTLAVTLMAPYKSSTIVMLFATNIITSNVKVSSSESRTVWSKLLSDDWLCVWQVSK